MQSVWMSVVRHQQLLLLLPLLWQSRQRQQLEKTALSSASSTV